MSVVCPSPKVPRTERRDTVQSLDLRSRDVIGRWGRAARSCILISKSHKISNPLVAYSLQRRVLAVRGSRNLLHEGQSRHRTVIIKVVMVGFNLQKFKGLSTAAYNGKLARITALFDDAIGRFHVELREEGDRGCIELNRKLLVKPATNMVRACDCCLFAGAVTMQYCGIVAGVRMRHIATLTANNRLEATQRRM